MVIISVLWLPGSLRLNRLLLLFLFCRCFNLTKVNFRWAELEEMVALGALHGLLLVQQSLHSHELAQARGTENTHARFVAVPILLLATERWTQTDQASFRCL